MHRNLKGNIVKNSRVVTKTYIHRLREWLKLKKELTNFTTITSVKREINGSETNF